MNDDDLKARSGLGVALDYLGQHAKAQEQYEEVLDHDSKNLDAQSGFILIFCRTDMILRSKS